MSKTNNNYNPESFDYKEIFDNIKSDWVRWAECNNAKKFIIGISGGKDSTVCATMAVKIFGKENVIGVLMPNGEQTDIEDSIEICEQLDIKYITMNIRDMYDSLVKLLKLSKVKITDAVIRNIPPRLRMTTLYSVAQSYEGGRVICTGNLSEATVGWTTLWGDSVGDYAPIAKLTCTEVVELGKYLGVDKTLIEKTPSDGLCGSTDEDALGFTYEELDEYIRTNATNCWEIQLKIFQRKKASQFKRDITDIPTCFPVTNYKSYSF